MGALIIIPCCKQKKVTGIRTHGLPLPGLGPVRHQLAQFIRQTPGLATRQANRTGILNQNASLTTSLDIYTGRFYQQARQALSSIATGHYPNIHVLIVSAAYGLVQLTEDLPEYDLTMGDKLAIGMPVYKFWQRQQLAQTVMNYLQQYSISHVWSLLPDSLPLFPYHRVFAALWANLRNAAIICTKVNIPGAGISTGTMRAAWLASVLQMTAGYLIGQPTYPPPAGFPTISYPVTYVRC